MIKAGEIQQIANNLGIRDTQIEKDYVIGWILKFFHFAHAVILTSGAYFAFLFNQILGWFYYAAISAAIFLSLFLGVLMELFFYKPLRGKKASAIISLHASLGIQFPNWFSDFDLIKNSLLSLLKREITLVKSENQFSLGIYTLSFKI